MPSQTNSLDSATSARRRRSNALGTCPVIGATLMKSNANIVVDLQKARRWSRVVRMFLSDLEINFTDLPRTRCTAIEAELRTLKEQVRQLQSSLADITDRQSKTSGATSTDIQTNISQESDGQNNRSQTRSQDIAAPTRIQYLGPTSSEFSFGVAKSALHRLGIQSEESDVRPDSAIPSRRASPGPSNKTSNISDPLLSLGLIEVRRSLGVYKDELHSIYPFMNIEEIITDAKNIYQRAEISYNRSSMNHEPPAINTGIRNIDVMILKMMIATALVVEGAGQSNIAQDLLYSVEEGISRSLKGITCDLKQLQLYTLTVRLLALDPTL